MVTEGESRLPTVEELRQELLGLFGQLEEKSKTNRLNSTIRYTGKVYFVDDDELFGISFSRRDYDPVSFERGVEIVAYNNKRAAAIVGSSGKIVKRAPKYTPIPYHPPIDLFVLTQHSGEDLKSFNGASISSYEELNAAVEVTRFLRQNIDEVTYEKPILEIPDNLKRLIEVMRQQDELQYEYKRNVFFEALAKVRKHSKKVKVDRELYRDPDNIIIVAATDWVKVSDGEDEFELRYEQVDGYSNGDWQIADWVRRRPIGNVGNDSVLFQDLEVSRGSFFSEVTTPQQVSKCTETLKLLLHGLQVAAKS